MNCLSQEQHTAESLAQVIDATIEGSGAVPVEGVSAADVATEKEIAFLTTPSYVKDWLKSQNRR